jgi:hypothetical protein
VQAAATLPFFPNRVAIEIKVGPKPRAYRDIDGVGFRRGDVGTHTSRTIMLAELTALCEAVPAGASAEDITIATRQGNCLVKSTTSTRRLTHQRLTELYALDPDVPIYRVLRRLWDLDAPARPLLAITVAVARDPLLAASAAAVVPLPVGNEFTRGPMKDAIRAATGDRLSDAILPRPERSMPTGNCSRPANSSSTRSTPPTVLWPPFARRHRATGEP